MKITRPPAKHLPETIIPLIDVVFFLLVFFMLVGRMDATSPFEVQPPVAVFGTDMPGGGSTVSVGADGALALDGVATTRNQLVDALATRLADDPGTFIRVNAHRSVELRKVLPLLTDLETLGAQDIALVVTPQESQ